MCCTYSFSLISEIFVSTLTFATSPNPDPAVVTFKAPTSVELHLTYKDSIALVGIESSINTNLPFQEAKLSSLSTPLPSLNFK
ncbi:hypothetical protein EVA_16207 [gut metagenome]|uniref:Uncharacterized protein n=1 Tax=gut metagenome TaxID=749906 RepID=J9FLB1_9ZZZZ